MRKKQKRVRGGEKMICALSILQKGALCTLDLLDELFNYQKSYARARARLYGGGEYFTKPRLPSRNDKLQAFYSLLTRLKNQGLIEKSENQTGTLWKITTAGFNKLMLLKDKKPLYNIESDDKLKIIAFDIPELEKFKRDWLRGTLKAMNFRMLQKSLWISKNKIPEAFLEDLRRKNLLRYVHILAVSRAGTIKELTPSS